LCRKSFLSFGDSDQGKIENTSEMMNYAHEADEAGGDIPLRQRQQGNLFPPADVANAADHEEKALKARRRNIDSLLSGESLDRRLRRHHITGTFKIPLMLLFNQLQLLTSVQASQFPVQLA
jgi:hypothetical protein